MNIDEATLIHDDIAGFKSWVMAAATLISSRDSAYSDLLQCLRRNGLPAEMAATTLYVRTLRIRRDDTCIIGAGSGRLV